jgi:hypothetical protein
LSVNEGVVYSILEDMISSSRRQISRKPWIRIHVIARKIWS